VKEILYRLDMGDTRQNVCGILSIGTTTSQMNDNTFVMI